MMFWLVLVLLGIAAAWLLVFPAIKAKPVIDTSRQALNAKIFKQRLAELETDWQEKRIDQEDYTALKVELERNFLADMERLEEGSVRNTGIARWVILSLLLLLPGITVLVYQTTGYNKALQQWLQTQEAVNPLIDQMMLGELKPEALQDIPAAEFIYALQRRAQRQPERAELWFILGNSFLQLQGTARGEQGRLQESASQALRRAYYLEETNVEYALAYSQTLINQNQGMLDPESRRILRKVLQQQPNMPGALMMLAMASYQGGDYQTAIQGWQTILDMGGDNPGYEKARGVLRRSIAQAEVKLAQQQDDTDDSPTTSAGALTIQVVLGSRQLNLQQGFLLVYAQAQQGPPMPLAIKKIPLPVSFPLTVALSDQDAMMPAMKLSQFDSVKVTARVSESGQATPQPGDWFGVIENVNSKSSKSVLQIRLAQQVN